MLIRFRQRLLDWFRTADHYPGGDKFEINAVEEPYPPMKRVARKPRGLTQYANDSNIKIGPAEGLESEAISFKVFPAAGGVAVQISAYDYKHDTRTVALHVIPEDKDLAESLAHILSLESLKR